MAPRSAEFCFTVSWKACDAMSGEFSIIKLSPCFLCLSKPCINNHKQFIMQSTFKTHSPCECLFSLGTPQLKFLFNTFEADYENHFQFNKRNFTQNSDYAYIQKNTWVAGATENKNEKITTKFKRMLQLLIQERRKINI